MARPKKEKEAAFCPICGKEMLGGDPIKLNLEQLSGRAGYHFSFETRMEMCPECSSSLITYLERWFKANDKTHKYKKFVAKG